MAVLAASRLDRADAPVLGLAVSHVVELRRRIREHGDRGLTETFTPGEIAYCQSSADPLPRLAARLAAKAAAVKAIKADGLRLEWTSIEVRRNHVGWCEVQLSGEAAQMASRKGIERLCVSLSHETDLAIAVVVDAGSIDRYGHRLLTVGADLSLVADVQESVDRFGQRFLSRVFTPLEQTACLSQPSPASHLAARFAAKEATIKALLVEDIQPDWPSMELRQDVDGSSYEMRLTGEAARQATDRGISRLSVTVSHNDYAAVAVVLARGNEGERPERERDVNPRRLL